MKQTGICYIVGGGDFNIDRFYPQKDDCIIAADSGLVYIEEAGYHPHLIVGDFDSLGYRPKGENVVCHPVEKDDTDVVLQPRLLWRRDMIQFISLVSPAEDWTIRWQISSC